MDISLKEYLVYCCNRAGFDMDYVQDFYERIIKNENVLNEFIYFVNAGSFLGKYNIDGISVADIIVYQIDYFKAAMDQDRLDMKFNRDKMLLEAINTMLKMDEDEEYCKKIKEDFLSISGTDKKDV